jgi:hypothetical protein
MPTSFPTRSLLADSNRTKLEGVFRNIDFNSESNLGRTKDSNRRLKNLLEDFSKPALDSRPTRVTLADGGPEPSMKAKTLLPSFRWVSIKINLDV